MAPGWDNYYPIPAGDCNYGAIIAIRSQLYKLYTEARQAVQFNLEDVFEEYPPLTMFPKSPLSFREIYISDADRDPNYFTRVVALDTVLHPQYERLELAERFGLERLKALGENWLGQLHSTSSFEVNSCAYRGNDVFVGCQWYAFEVREEGENFKVVWLDYGFADLKGSSLNFRANYPLVDGTVICDKRSFRS